MEDHKQSVTIDSVLCRLEMKEMDEVAERRSVMYDLLLDQMRLQYHVSCGQINSSSKKKMAKMGGPLNLREFGLLVARVGLEAIRASEEPDDEEEDDDEEEEE